MRLLLGVNFWSMCDCNSSYQEFFTWRYTTSPHLSLIHRYDSAILDLLIQLPFWDSWIFKAIVGLVLLLLAAALVGFYANHLKAKQRVLNQIKDLELRALKSQMNPHFIFNAMNSIQALIASENPTEALRYTSKFSKLMRIVLEDSEKSVISLDKEISALELYIQIETLRLNFNLEYKIEVHRSIAPEIDVIPPMIIQPYVENALWHGLSNKDGLRKLSVWFFADDKYLFCEVTDNGIGRKKSAELKNKAANPSKDHSLTEKRLRLINHLDNVSAIVTTDLFDEDGYAAGTKVLLKIPRNFN